MSALNRQHKELEPTPVGLAGPAVAWAVIALVVTLLVSYGFEIFSNYLTVDEEVVGELSSSSYAKSWVTQGRWSMGLLTLALPSSVAPVVSTALGVGLSGIAWWQISRRYLQLNAWESAFAVSLAGTIPVLAFIISFSTIAFGIGVANLLLVAYLRGLASSSWLHRLLGVLAGAAAVGIYDTFLAAIAAVSLALVLKRPSYVTAALVVGASTLALLISRAVGSVASYAFGAGQDSYLSRYLDVAGLLQDPASRSIDAIKNVLKTLSLSSERFGLSSPWLGITLLVLLLVALISVLSSNVGAKTVSIRVAALGSLVLIPFVSEAVSLGPVPLRSMLYLPIVVLVVSSVAIEGLRRMSGLPRALSRGAVATLIILAVLGNATISNRLFSAAENTFEQDQALAFVIGVEKDKLLGGDNTKSLPLLVSGAHSWPDSSLMPTRETLGSSFFEWNGGASHRIAAFLRSQGVAVDKSLPAETAQAWETLHRMPNYPLAGWIAVEDGILLLKFGDRTIGYQ